MGESRTFTCTIADEDMLLADQAIGENGMAILRTFELPGGVRYIDVRDCGMLRVVERAKWRVGNFWAQVAIGVLLQWCWERTGMAPLYGHTVRGDSSQ